MRAQKRPEFTPVMKVRRGAGCCCAESASPCGGESLVVSVLLAQGAGSGAVCGASTDTFAAAAPDRSSRETVVVMAAIEASWLRRGTTELRCDDADDGALRGSFTWDTCTECSFGDGANVASAIDGDDTHGAEAAHGWCWYAKRRTLQRPNIDASDDTPWWRPRRRGMSRCTVLASYVKTFAAKSTAPGSAAVGSKYTSVQYRQLKGASTASASSATGVGGCAHVLTAVSGRSLEDAVSSALARTSSVPTAPAVDAAELTLCGSGGRTSSDSDAAGARLASRSAKLFPALVGSPLAGGSERRGDGCRFASRWPPEDGPSSGSTVLPFRSTPPWDGGKSSTSPSHRRAVGASMSRQISSRSAGRSLASRAMPSATHAASA
mmetsp:Transcript_17953/g.55777  ORF Transcript_17953/g.55777 Transcript_17953/m.55777 type:complete len:379 (+) Transcript_17953:245-1381(+)